MKKYLFALLCLGITLNLVSQQIIGKTEKEEYLVDGSYYFVIYKKDISSSKILFTAETNIPDKKAKESYNTFNNDSYFFLVGENIVIVYDVWQKSNSSKECYIWFLNTKTGQFGEKKLLYSTQLNSAYSSGDIRYIPVFSPDRSKLAVIKENKSPGYNIDPEINIYDMKTLNVISTKKLAQKYNDQKRVLNKNISMDNNGNISLIFHLLNEETKMTTKSFSADIPFNETDLKNIKQLESIATASESNHGRFYKSLQDYIDEKPMKGLRIKDGSYNWSKFTGTGFKLIDDDGKIIRESVKDFPSELFTYNGHLMRLIDNAPYIVLVAGKMNYYSEYLEQNRRFYAEGWNGKLKKFKEKDFENYLKKYDLLEAYKKDKPKREMSDDVNGYFNKIVGWQIDYFNKLNKKMP